MSAELIILLMVVVTALAFDFTNGFHDTGNAMATSIATGALKPKVAVALSGVLNLVGAFLSVEVAATVAKDVLTMKIAGPEHAIHGTTVGGTEAMTIIFAGLIGGITWNLLTWLVGLPSSSSHALFGGLIGAGLAGLGTAGINWNGIVSKVIYPALVSPFIAGTVAAIGTFAVYAITKKMKTTNRDRDFRWGQIGSASLVSLAHGTGDAQKTMGVIAMALIAHGTLTADGIDKDGIPLWVIFCCGLAISLGTYLGGWRIIRTLGKGLIEIEAPQGMAAESASAAIILSSSHLGMALSTTHVATGSILGAGVGKRGATVRWRVAGHMAAAWLITLPAAAVVGAFSYFIAHLIGGLAGAITIFVLLIAFATYMYLHSRKAKVDHNSVNDDWGAGSSASGTHVESMAATK